MVIEQSPPFSKNYIGSEGRPAAAKLLHLTFDSAKNHVLAEVELLRLSVVE